MIRRETGVTLGLDVGSTYTKAVVIDSSHRLLARAMEPTGSRLEQTAQRTADAALDLADLARGDVDYTITTGYGRHLIPFRNLQVTDLTAAARGARHLFPATRTVLDVGGQTMKASRLDADGRVETFRLNDKCAAGTGAFLEKTARYMGYSTADIGELVASGETAVSISGVCAVFAESEVISHLSEGVAPQNIMLGALRSLTERSVQLLRRIKAEPEFTLVGGILRWPAFAMLVAERLGEEVRVAEGDLPQYVAALSSRDATAPMLRSTTRLAQRPAMQSRARRSRRHREPQRRHPHPLRGASPDRARPRLPGGDRPRGAARAPAGCEDRRRSAGVDPRLRGSMPSRQGRGSPVRGDGGGRPRAGRRRARRDARGARERARSRSRHGRRRRPRSGRRR
jgi:predicted CoA-substrate-specific enzyme activase